MCLHVRTVLTEAPTFYMKQPDGRDIGYVYGLLDPRTGKCHYVGETDGGLDKRRGLHIAMALGAFDGNGGHSGRNNFELRDWIAGLLKENLTPRIVDLEEIVQVGDKKLDKRTRWDAEQRWIRTLKEADHPLTNRVTGLPKGHVFAEGTGPRKLKGRKRPELAAKLRGREIDPVVGPKISQSLRQRTADMKADGTWDSPEQRAIRSAKVKAAWTKRNANRIANGGESAETRATRSRTQLDRRERERKAKP